MVLRAEFAFLLLQFLFIAFLLLLHREQSWSVIKFCAMIAILRVPNVTHSLRFLYDPKGILKQTVTSDLAGMKFAMPLFESLKIFSNIRKTFQVPFSGCIENEIG